jgi:hypothetical protein
MQAGRVRDDAGGVWIVTGWVLGALVWIGVVVAWHAGFTGATPFVVIPPVLLVMIAAGNWIGGRRPGRQAARFHRPDPVPLASLRGAPEPTPGTPGTGATDATGRTNGTGGTDGATAGGPGPGR